MRKHWWLIVEKATNNPHPYCTAYNKKSRAEYILGHWKFWFNTPHGIIKVKECDGSIPSKRDASGRRLWWWIILESDTHKATFLLKVGTSYKQVSGCNKFKHLKAIKVIPA